MDPTLLMGGVAAAGLSGLSIGIGARLLPSVARARRDLRRYHLSPATVRERRFEDEDRALRALTKPPGRRRETSIAGVYGDALRHKSGAYTRAYDLPLRASMFAPDARVEAFCDDLARMLSVPMPPGTVMQFRYAVGPDAGAAVARHLVTRDYEQIYWPAARLHDLGVDFYKRRADAGLYRHERASLIVTVPVKLSGDETGQGLSAFIPAVTREIKRSGLKDLRQMIARTWADTADDGLVRRLLADEAEAFERFEKVCRVIELNAPVQLRRLGRQGLWEAVFKSHCLNARSVPKLPPTPGYDVSAYLCSETIEGGSWYVRHGDVPAGVISMISPGEPHIYADSMRALTANPNLTFRHTVICEFVTLDPRRVTKALDKRIKSVRRTNTRADGRQRSTPEARAALKDLETVREHITGSRESLLQMRCYVVVYGEAARTRGELKRSLAALDERCEAVTGALETIDGVEAAREEPAALQFLYERTLLGETDGRPTGREITEVAHSLAAFVPIETAASGSARAHTLLATQSGRLTGLNLWDKSKIKSPLILVLGEPGAGKTTTTARLANDALAYVPEVRVCLLDVGGSIAPHAEIVGARYLRLTPDDPRTINIWDYPELTQGEMAPDETITLIVMDALTLAGARDDDPLASDILTKAVKEVLRNFAPRNGPGRRKREPTHAHLVAMLESYDFGNRRLNDRAAELALALEKYVGNRYLDAPTDADFLIETPYDLYEIDSLDAFPAEVRTTLANRIAARVVRSIGRLKEDGTRTPTLLAFVEVWKLIRSYPGIMRVIQKGARTGRRDNVVTILESHTYNDFAGIYDLTATAGCSFIGKQTGEIIRLIEDAKLPARAVDAIHAIKNIDGEYTQWVMVTGSGGDQQIELVQIDLSPAELWTFTTHPDERNARARVSFLRPEWSLLEVTEWLAAQYPRGLVARGLHQIDESLLLKSVTEA